MSRRAVTVWLTDAEFAKVDGVAERLKVETGALCRLAIASGIVLAGHEVSVGRVRLRARSSRVPVPVAAAEEASGGGDSEPGQPVVAKTVRGLPASPQRSRADGPAVDRVSAFRRATQR